MIQTKETKHGTIIVDEFDADLLVNCRVSNPKGRNTQYVISTNAGRAELIHRLILRRVIGRGLTTKEHVDHANGDGLDNRRSNLRLATRSQNQGNRRMNAGNKSGFKGVCWVAANEMWRARITVDKVRINLGHYDTPADAHRAYVEAAQKYFGEFAHDGRTSK